MAFCPSFYHYSNFELAIDKKLKLDTINLGKTKKAQAQLVMKCGLIKNKLLARSKKSILTMTAVCLVHHSSESVWSHLSPDTKSV